MISFRLGRGSFTLRALPSFITLFLLIGLLALGFWQVRRLHWKIHLLQTIDYRTNQSLIDLKDVDDLSSIDYRPVLAHGTYVAALPLLLSTISLKGEGGYDLINALKADNGDILMIDRGWIPYAERAHLSSYAPPPNVVAIKGHLRLPHHHWLQPDDRPEQNEWYGIDPARMAKSFGLDDAKDYYLSEDASDQAGYPEAGQMRVDLPNNHFTYAVIWFGLALVLLVVYLISSWKPHPRAENKTVN